MKTMTAQIKKDLQVIARFTEVWCGGHQHTGRQPVVLPGGGRSFALCPTCAEFVAYAVNKRLNCPLKADKPRCKRCRIHCYAPQQREMVRQIMAWSGRQMILRGRVDYLWHYFF